MLAFDLLRRLAHIAKHTTAGPPKQKHHSCSLAAHLPTLHSAPFLVPIGSTSSSFLTSQTDSSLAETISRAPNRVGTTTSRTARRQQCLAEFYKHVISVNDIARTPTGIRLDLGARVDKAVRINYDVTSQKGSKPDGEKGSRKTT